VVGVDVGEDFLDLAILRIKSLALEHRRVALGGIEDDPLRILSRRIADCCREADSKWLALIDSPRWPLDLDLSSHTIVARDPVPAGRILDQALRAMLRASPRHSAILLSMFPTPKFAYFRQCAGASACKPHLRAAYRQLFENGTTHPASDQVSSSAPVPGGNFTRFMLAGFLTFRAWQELGVQVLEAYPDLQYRLSSGDALPPKREGKAAVAQRIAITRRLRESLGIGLTSRPATLDQADAEVLALSAALAAQQGSLAALEHPAEGRFLLTF
jgi:hypothetical protein